MKLNRTNLPKLLKLLITGLLSLVLAYVLFAVGFVLWPDINDYLSRMPFDEQRWRSWEEGPNESEWGLRWKMTVDLFDTYHLIGMTRAEIFQLLGTPDDETNNMLYYYLGINGHGIDTGLLVLLLDEHGRVTEYKKLST